MCGWPKKWGRRDGITLHESSWKWMEMGVYPISRHIKKKKMGFSGFVNL
jgi:hypothetical protein